jgi:tetratricopeptide (TPR) repeat protein
MTEVYGGFYNLQGMAQFAEADYDDAAKSLEKVRGKSQDYTGYMYLGRVALEKDNPKLALHYFRTVFNMQPTDTARLYLSVALKLSGDEAAGRAHYDQAVNSAKLRRAHAKSHYEYFEALGRAHQAWGCLDEGAAAYTRVIDAVPRLGYGHRQLGEIYCRQGNKSAALSQLREALRLMPQDARTIMLLEEVGE